MVEIPEIIRRLTFTRIPLAPSLIEGLVNLRGQIVTAIDMRQRIGCIFGSRGEVERLNRYHSEGAGALPEVSQQWNPLYGQRGLFNTV